MPADQAPREPAEPGDVLPNLILPDAQGSGVGLSQPAYAGRWQVVVFLDPETLKGARRSLEEAAQRLDKSEGVLHAVALSVPDPDLEDAALFDQSGGGAAFLLGESGAGIAVLSPGGRLSARFGPGELAAAVTYCETAFAAEETGAVSGGAPVLVLPEVLEPGLCGRIIEFWNSAPVSAEAEEAEDPHIPEGELFSDVRRRIVRRVLPMVERALAFKVSSMEPLRVSCGTPGETGSAPRGRHNTTRSTAHRRLALTFDLNGNDFEGGELRFPEFGRRLYRAPAGGALVYSCSLLHEALPVTAGDRFSMYTFFTDAAGPGQRAQAAPRS